MTKIIFLVLFVSCSHIILAQVRRNYTYQGTPVTVLAKTNRTDNSFGFPGMNAFIIVGDSLQLLNDIYASDKLHQMPVTGMNNYACFYYMQANRLMSDTSLYKFLKAFITWCYEADYIDRNSVHLVWNTTFPVVSCSTFRSLDTIISSVYALPENISEGCDIYAASAPAFIWRKSQETTTIIKYYIPSMMEVEEQERQRQKAAELLAYNKKKGNVFLQLTIGNYNISSLHKTSFDTNTLVDFTRHKTLWNINAGYHLSHRLFAGIDFAFIYSGRQKNIESIDRSGNGITVKGTGYAGAMLRYGVGIGLLAYSRNRLDVLLHVHTGKLDAFAGGGEATRTLGSGGGNTNTTNIAKSSEQSLYTNVVTGINYRLGNAVYCTGNLQYCISSFPRSIGSVTGFTGWSCNLGIGFIIPTSNDK